MTKINFKINGLQYEADGKYGPDVTLNEYIRTVADLRGTKVMCQEGGCGACIVAVRVAQPPTHELKTFAVNSCLVSILSCHNWEITTVEGIGNRTIGYHEIQSRLAKFNGTQCGYCTPGWIMNMYSLYTAKNKKLTAIDVENSFAGNICRCTGYRPIADAFKSFASDADVRIKKKIIDIEEVATFKCCGVTCKNNCKHKTSSIKEMNKNKNKEEEWCVIDKGTTDLLTIQSDSHKWFKVTSLNDTFKAMSDCSDYKLIAGNTGQGVYHVTEYPKNIIDIFNVSEIKGYSLDINLILGAGMVLNEMMELFLRFSSENENFAYLREFYHHMDLVAHIPVRNIGTIGGNLYMKYAYNEFPSDLFLLFETVGAMITIAETNNRRKTVNLSDFLTLNMKNAVIVNILLPPLSRSCHVKTYKIMPRSQNAHAIVNAGFLIKLKANNLIEKATIVYGNITPQFIHAEKTEKLLNDTDPFTDGALQIALKSLYDEIHPDTTPPEPSAKYRRLLAVALFYKAILSLCPEGKLNEVYRSGGDVIKRDISRGTQIYDTDESVWPLNKPVPKLEALVQCSGEAIFANDLPKQTNEVYATFVTADIKPGSHITGFDTTEAFKIPGVLAFYTAKDIPGDNNFTPTNIAILNSIEEIVCSKEIKFYGQTVGIMVADREKTANNAAKLVEIKYEPTTTAPLITVQDILSSPKKDQRITTIQIKIPIDAGNDVKHIIRGEVILESQYHYYMEPQTCVVNPTEDGLEVYSSTQFLDLTNIAVAQCLKVPVNSVNVIVRRVGGGYGGKITRSSQVACAAAVVSHLQGKPCRFVLPLQTNMKIIGKRAPTYCQFEVGVNQDGEIQNLKIIYYQDNGCSSNETIAYMTMNHFPNCYDTKRWRIEAYSVLTDTPSTTWCRAPASTEGVAIIEHIMEKIAYTVKKDPLEVRTVNMKKDDNPIPELVEQLKKDSSFDERLQQVKIFNEKNRWRKRALKLMPMTYELFYIGPYNSVVSVYHGDGSVVITHGAIEMGQGINTKTAQVCAYVLDIPLEKISVKPSTSFTSPNSMATGGSVGSELVAYATMKACEILLERLKPIREKLGNPSWEDLIKEAHNSGIYLQSSYMYSTNEPVKPYDIYCVVALEVEVDILTGNHDIKRVDLLEDTGRSLNPEIDIAQIEGAFVMGLGYWTSEKMVYDRETGKLLTDRTWTYKPPGIKDIPADFRIYFRRNSVNKYGVLQSKATGEPALCMAAVITHAFREIVSLSRLDAGYQDEWVDIASTEGVAIIEHIMEKIAYTVKKDPLEVRTVNMKKDDNPIPELVEQLKKDSSFDERLQQVKIFNEKNRWRKRALKLMPMTYELFYIGPYNSVVSVYHGDGSVVITHGAIEMGQGINTKTAQVCAYVLDIPLEKISVKPSTSFTSPNSMATGGSVGSELVAYATMKACEILLERLKPIREKLGNPSWEDLIKEAHNSGIYLQSSYMYSTNEPVKPYDIYCVVALEVEVDILTGNHDIKRVDLLEDTGRSLNPEIDIAQIEGAFVMGLGYWTSEKMVYDRETGKLLTDRTWTYKPPGIKDIPADFRIYFRRNSVNKYGVLQSKATGEPALCMAAVITHAFREIVSLSRLDAGYQDEWVDIEHPCTSENIFMAMEHKLEYFKLT